MLLCAGVTEEKNVYDFSNVWVHSQVWCPQKKFPLSKNPFTTASRAFDGIRKCDVEHGTHLKCLDFSSPVKYKAFDEEFQNFKFTYPKYIHKYLSSLEKPS